MHSGGGLAIIPGTDIDIKAYQEGKAATLVPAIFDKVVEHKEGTAWDWDRAGPHTARGTTPAGRPRRGCALRRFSISRKAWSWRTPHSTLIHCL